MAAECIALSAVQNFANKDVNRIIGKVAEVLALKSPYMDILDGGSLPNVSDVVRSVVQERSATSHSLAAPVFTSDITLCGTSGTPDQVGSTEYSFGLESLRGRGPRVCVKTSRTAFKGSYLQAQISLEKMILQLTNADIRSTLQYRSGVKMVVRDDQPLSTLITGDVQAIDTLFYQDVPNAPLSFKTLYKLGTFLKEEMLADPFESDNGTMFKVVMGIDQIERFRDELSVREDLRALVTGRYTLGEKSIDGYSFMGPYRGFAFGYDQQPLRFTGFNPNGTPALIEPEIAVATTKGVGARRNPAWVTALYEIGFIFCANSFKRLIPEQYTGEGTFKFAPQLFAGELEWFMQRDWDCNLYGDFGQHLYQISRAYQPVRPHAVMPIAYQRCNFDLGLSGCASTSNGL
jgi:hypothetical protein